MKRLWHNTPTSNLVSAFSSLHALEKRPRIALITPLLPVPHDVTRGRFIVETALALSQLCDVKVFFQQLRYLDVPFLKARSYIYAPMPENYTFPGLNVHALEYPGVPVLTRPLNSYLSASALLGPMRAYAPDAVLAYWVYPDGHAALQCARKLKIPCVIGALGTDINVRDRLNAWFTRRAINGADALITVSEAMRQTAIANYGARAEKVHTLVNGFNTGVFHLRNQAAMRAKFEIASDLKLIIYVGRLIEAKGLRELVKAFAALSARHSDYRLVFAGDGVMREELKLLISASSLDSKVLMPGGLEPSAVAEWISASDVLCLPSWSEGYPNVLVEALACGRPVVATTVGGIGEIVGPEAGLLVPPKNPLLLEQALDRVLQKTWDERRIAALITRTWNDVAADTLEICKQAIKSHH